MRLFDYMLPFTRLVSSKWIKNNVRIPIQSSLLSRSCEKANWRLSTKLPPSRRGRCGLDKTNKISNPKLHFIKKIVNRGSMFVLSNPMCPQRDGGNFVESRQFAFSRDRLRNEPWNFEFTQFFNENGLET